MSLSIVQKGLNTAAIVVGGFFLSVTSWPYTAIAQTPASDSGISESDRTSRLEALQRSVLQRTTENSSTAPTAAETAVPPVSGTVSDSTSPLPEELSEAIAIATPVNDQLSISVINNTGTTITYEALGDTDVRQLMMDESIMLQGISLPTTLTFVRPDNGFVEVSVTPSQEGMLEIVLTPKETFDDVKGVVRIQAGGQVFLN